MPNFIIHGGKPLYGSVRVSGAKNASYKLMIAALLADTPSRLLNFSHISDVALVAKIINQLGAQAELVGERAYMINPVGFSTSTIGNDNGEVSRASTLFIPALLAKFGEAIVPFPGGDKIGARPLDRHFDGLEALGAKVEISGQQIRVSASRLAGTTYRFVKNSHTGTETLIMAALKAKGRTILENAAEENEIDDLIAFCNAMGGKVHRQPGKIIVIEGVEHLQGAIHKIMPDHNQVVSFACAALATKGDIIIEDAHAKDIPAFIEKLDAIGAGYEIGNYGIRFFWKQPLKATDVTTQIAPGFKTDWQPLWAVMMTQATGVSVLHETVYESRFAYVQSLQAMGAKIELFNPPVENPDEVYNFNLADAKKDSLHAARITGPSLLIGGTFEVKDLRHGATLTIAGLVASGTTTLRDPGHQIARGYEEFDDRLRALGADIVTKES
jgi:UDP-N-acetylglucosamine 1-carboxyvinyltransferase